MNTWNGRRGLGVALAYAFVLVACAPALQSGIGELSSEPSADLPQVRILHMLEGDRVAGIYDAEDKPLVPITVEVTGIAPFDIQLTANGISTGASVANPEGGVPFVGVLACRRSTAGASMIW